jgi:general secretion pathway protein K
VTRRGREGFILVSVLGALIVLSGLVAAVSYLVRTAVIGAASVRQELSTDVLTRSGVELAGYELFMLRRPAAFVNNQRIRMNDGVITLFVRSEAGRIDLNAASPELLAGLWSSIGAPGGMRPETFAARVVDYRDEDSELSKNGGAEAAEYKAAGPTRLPANAPFEQVDDLQNVLGVPAEAVRALAPLVTVHNPSGKLSAFDASPAVLRALPGGSSLVDRIAALRARPPQDAEDGLEEALGEAAEFITLEQRPIAFTVRVEIERGDARRSTDVTLVASRSSDALYFVTDRLDRPSG